MKNFYNAPRGLAGLEIGQVVHGGGMLADGKLQDIHSVSTIQNYEIGSRLLMDDRMFRYCKAGAALRELIPGANADGQTEVNTDTTNRVVGVSVVTILDTTVRVVNYYAGGYYWVMYYAPATTGIGILYRIVSSTAGTGTSVVLTLATPITRAIPSTTWSTAWPSIYGNVSNAQMPKASMVCMPLVQVASGSYFWGQTGGPCFAQCGYSPGSKDYDREFYYKGNLDGVLPGSEVDFTSDVIPQIVWYLLPNTGVVGTYNFFMLQLEA